MKKIALFSLMCCLCGVFAVPAFAGSCGGQRVILDGFNQKPGDDEFLYTNSSARTKAIEDYSKGGKDKDDMRNGSKYKLSGGSWVLECDKGQCVDGTVVYLHNGGVAENLIGNWFKCYVGKLDDRWMSVDKCINNRELQEFKGDFYSADDKNGVRKKIAKNYKLFAYKGTQSPCYCLDEITDQGGKIFCSVKAEKTEQKPQPQPQPVTGGCLEIDGVTRIAKGNNSVHQVCQVKALSDAGAEQCVCQCVDDNKWRCDVTSCKGDSYGRNYNWVENETNVSGGKGVCKEAKKGTPVTKSCKDSRRTQNGKACCDVPKTQAEYDAKTDSCNCLDKNAEFKIIDNKGQCVEKQQTPATAQCTYTVSGTIKCPNGTTKTLKNEYVTVSVPCEGKTDKNISLDNQDVQRAVEGLNEDVRKKLLEMCNETTTVAPAPFAQQQSGPTQSQIESAKSTLAAFTGRAEKEASVWKDGEGNFNKARLASDLTAGVVLGTVGGVVSGVVIKKNQKKKGFEALNCSVGGQKVADWGDSFQVSYRR